MQCEYRVDITAPAWSVVGYVDSEWQQLILKPCSAGMNAAGTASIAPAVTSSHGQSMTH